MIEGINSQWLMDKMTTIIIKIVAKNNLIAAILESATTNCNNWCRR
jgi:hypothetical protein